MPNPETLPSEQSQESIGYLDYKTLKEKLLNKSIDFKKAINLLFK